MKGNGHMTRKTDLRWVLLVVANVAFWCMLSLQQSNAAARASAPGGPSATQQRAEIIAELKAIRHEVKFLAAWRRSEALPEVNPIQP
jgi:hypothetical protein